jgi:exo-beta-1,3-glucanase (GH17 family)
VDKDFSCTDGNELIPALQRERLKVWRRLAGERTRRKMRKSSQLGSVVREGNADLVAVGNEVLYREELTEEELLEYIHRVKEMLPGIPVGYVDAYYEFVNRPAITEACDVIFTNCYPFWEGCHIDYSLVYIKK